RLPPPHAHPSPPRRSSDLPLQPLVHDGVLRQPREGAAVQGQDEAVARLVATIARSRTRNGWIVATIARSRARNGWIVATIARSQIGRASCRERVRIRVV